MTDKIVFPVAQPFCDQTSRPQTQFLTGFISLVVTNTIGDLNKAGKQPRIYCVPSSCEKKNGIQSCGPCFQGVDSLGSKRLILCANDVNQPVLSTFAYLLYARNHIQR